MTAEQLAAYDVTWTTPSRDATGSMPIGNGDLAANVWVEPNGDVLLLVAKGDAWDENSTLCKLGRVRLRCDPPLDVGANFEACLSLSDATVVITAGGVRVSVWAEWDAPAIRVQVECEPANAVHVTLETWRNYPYRVWPTQTGDMFKNLTGRDPFPTIVSPDETAARGSDTLLVWHANQSHATDPVETNLKLQGLGDALRHIPPPLHGRVFGMAMVGRGFVATGPRTLSFAAASQHQLDLHALTLPAASTEDWQAAMCRQVDGDAFDVVSSAVAHAVAWQTFWERSTLVITSSADEDNAFNVARGYVLQRYMNACQGRSAQPIKFNGGLFSVGRPWDPDFRRWGGPGFWFQNLRLVYWPMLADGDFDLMRPWIKMYRDCLPLQQHRTKTYYGHDGAHYPETMTFWGAEVSGHYGWTPFEQRVAPEAECAYLTYYWSGGIELTLMLAEYVEHTLDADALTALDEIGRAVLTFYEQHYPRTADGTLRFEPAQALETWHKAVDPMPEIAGLHYLTARLLAMPEDRTSEAIRDQCRRLAASLPPLPVGERDGERVLLPAAAFDIKKNTENPELYCIFPYRLFGVGKPDLDLARRTFDRRLHVEHTCWHQDAIQMALLGLTVQAKDFVSRRADPACASDSRFPAFWNAFHDWNPDVDHGGVLQLAVQNMLVQCEGNLIRLLPAWPSDWDADFKFHLPGPAVIEGAVRAGRLMRWGIEPRSRAKDVLVPSPGTPGEG